MNAIADKQFPENYSLEVLEVLRAMSMTDLKHLKVAGSSSIRSMLYAGDYDAIEKVSVSSADEIVPKLRAIAKALGPSIVEIKCGEVKEWEVVPASARIEDGRIVNFNRVASQKVVDELRRGNIISPCEAKEAEELLRKATDAFGFLDAKKNLRFHILRWKPIDIINGVLDYRGRSIVLEDAIKSGGLIKCDVVANIESRFTEFSCIYDVFVKGKRISAPIPPMVRGLTEDIIYYDVVNPFKALKRAFSLAKYYRELRVIEKLVPILNGDLGRLYQIIGDMKTLEGLLERPGAPIAEIRSQIDDVRHRLGNIYQMKGILSNEHSIIGSIISMLKQSKGRFEDSLGRLIETMEDLLDRETRRALGVKAADLVP